MSEWKGPWKCEKCGQIFPPNWLGPVHWLPNKRGCRGIAYPYDRRAPDPDLLSLLREARDALKKALDELAVQTEASGGHLGIITTIFARIDAVLEEKP